MLKKIVCRRLAFVFTPLLSLIFVFSFALLPNIQNAAAGLPTCTWTGNGGNSNFATVGNWTCDTGTLPTNGTQLIFNKLGNATLNNDLSASLTFSGISIVATTTQSNEYLDFVGNGFNLSGNIDATVNSSFDFPLIDMRFGAITLSSDSILTMHDASNKPFNMNFGYTGNTINLNGHNLVTNIGNAVTTNGTKANCILIGASISGAGNITVNGAGIQNAQNTSVNTLNLMSDSTFSGTLTLNNVDVGADLSKQVFGSTSGGTIFNGFSTLFDSTYTVPQPAVTVAENLTFSNSQTPYDRITIIKGPEAGNNNPYSYAERYFYPYVTTPITFTGTLTLLGNLKVLTSNSPTTFSGPIVGSGFTISNVYYPTVGGGNLVINGSTNNTATANGTYGSAVNTSTLTDSNTNTVYIGYHFKVLVNGSRGAIKVANGGILGGSGTVGALTVQSAKVSPGNSPGQLNTGNVSFDSSSSLDEEIGGTTAGTGYDQLNVTGTVSLGSATLNILTYNGFTPALGDVYTIINNDSTDAVTGAFNAMAEGSRTTIGGYTYKISYIGGTGNDVTLTVTGTPGAPDTSGALAKPVNIVIAIGVVLAGIAVIIVRKKYLKSTQKVAVRSRK